MNKKKKKKREPEGGEGCNYNFLPGRLACLRVSAVSLSSRRPPHLAQRAYDSQTASVGAAGIASRNMPIILRLVKFP
jgi:hypothetical protein